MSFARFVPLYALLGVGLLAISSIQVPYEFSPNRFEPGDYALLRARYEELRRLPGPARAELLGEVGQICREAPLAPPMIEQMQIFSQSIVHARDESAEVKEEARKLLRILEARRTSAPPTTALRRSTASSP